MFKTKLTLLLIAIFLLNIDFLLSYPALADEVSGTDQTKFSSRFNSSGSFSRASDPECGAFKTAAATAGIAIAVGAIFVGIVLTVSSAGLFTLLAIIGTIAAIIGVWKAIGGLVVCQHSFVKHPIARDYDGKYQDFELKDANYSNEVNKNYLTEDDYFSALKAKSGKDDGKKAEKEILNFSQQNSTTDYYWPKKWYSI